MRHLNGKFKCYSTTKVKKLYQNRYLHEINQLKRSIQNWDDLYSEELTEDHIGQLIRIEVLGKSISEKYAWAIPDLRALKILSNYSPLIEIGCGKKYWGSQIERISQIHVVGYDRDIESETFGEVLQGGAEVLLNKEYEHHNLFLCYPDEDTSLAYECLENFQGIILAAYTTKRKCILMYTLVYVLVIYTHLCMCV